MIEAIDEEEKNKIQDKYLFKPSNSSGSSFVNIKPNDEILMFVKTEQEGIYQAFVSIENVNTQSLVAFYINSTAKQDWEIKPQRGFILPKENKQVAIRIKVASIKELDDKLIFIRCLPLSETFEAKNIEEYDTDEHCWKRGNINILFAVDALYTKYDAEGVYKYPQLEELQLEDQQIIENEQPNAQKMGVLPPLGSGKHKFKTDDSSID